MSMKSWSEYGFGYETDNGKNLPQIKTFLIDNLPVKENPEQIRQIQQAEDTDELEMIVNNPVPHLLASIINKKEGISLMCGFLPCSDTDAPARLGIIPAYPWDLTESDRKLTQNDAEVLLKKYAELLGITETPDFFEQEYYG